MTYTYITHNIRTLVTYTNIIRTKEMDTRDLYKHIFSLASYNLVASFSYCISHLPLLSNDSLSITKL